MIPLEREDKLALLIVDMQYDSVDPRGALPAKDAGSIVSNLAALARAARLASWPVVYTQHVHRADLSDFGIAHHFEQPSCLADTRGADIVEQLAPEDSDTVVQKRRYDAFIGTDLDLVLRSFGVTGLVVCGVLTDGCVLGTVTHARCLDYKAWLVRDALAGTSWDLHESALTVMQTYMADTCEAGEILAFMESSAQDTDSLGGSADDLGNSV